MTVPEGERAAIQPGTARSESAQALTPNPVDGASPSAQLGNPSHATSIDGTQTTTRAGIVTGGEALATFSPRSAIPPVFPRTDVSPSGASQVREAPPTAVELPKINPADGPDEHTIIPLADTPPSAITAPSQRDTLQQNDNLPMSVTSKIDTDNPEDTSAVSVPQEDFSYEGEKAPETVAYSHQQTEAPHQGIYSTVESPAVKSGPELEKDTLEPPSPQTTTVPDAELPPQAAIAKAEHFATVQNIEERGHLEGTPEEDALIISKLLLKPPDTVVETGAKSQGENP